MLPDGWKECFLGELVDGTIKNGFSANPVEKISGMYILSLGCLTEDGLIVDQIKNIDKSISLSEYILQPGDFLVSRSNTPDKVGRSAMFRGEIKNCIYPDLMMRFRVKKTVSANFIESALKHFRARQYLKKSASGSSLSMVKITKATLEKLPISLPPLPEQEKIAAILSTWDKAISTTDALLENSCRQKKALMQQLLTGKRRLPGFKGEWKTVPLNSIAMRINERNNGQSNNVVTISAQKGLIRQEEFFNKSVASENLDMYFILRKGQFAYNKSYSIGYPMGAIKRLKSYETGVVTSLYICFDITSNKADADFYEFLFDSGILNESLIKIAAEGGRAHGLLNVKPSDFMKLPVTFPPLDEQRAIAAVLDAADREISLLEQKAARLREEKKALMQQLLTGKRRVRV